MKSDNSNQVTPRLQFRKNLKELIIQKGVTIVFLSQTTKIPLQTIHGWLSGTSPRNLYQLKILAEYFEISIHTLCFEKIDDKKKIEIDVLEDIIASGKFEIILKKIKT